MLKTAVLFAALSLGLAFLAPSVLPLIQEAEAPPAAKKTLASPQRQTLAFAPPVAAAATPPQTSEHEIALPANAMGHYTADVMLNGQSVPMLIDTGATYVSLSAATAERIGLVPPPGARRMRMQTANGVAFATQVSLDSVELGPIFVPGVQAIVMDRSAGDVNLLGMSMLGRLSGVEQRSGYLHLRQ